MPIAELVLVYEQLEKRIAIDPDMSYGIGRGPHNAVCIPSNRVSRDHALLKQDESGTFCVFDLGSSNGTFLNNRLLSGCARLNHGDVISVGDATISFAALLYPVEPAAGPRLMSSRTTVASEIALVTVLVVDVRDFTLLTARLGPARIGELIRTFNQASGELLDQSSAWAKKFIGDAVMALWVNKTAESRFKTIVAALEVSGQVAAMASQLHVLMGLPDPIGVGAGINAGLASVGNFGAGTTADCTALGDTVNRAFRLESATRKLGCDVVFGSEVYEVLSKRLDIGEFAVRHRTALKGYVEECDVYAMNGSDVAGLLNALRPADGADKCAS